MVPEWFFRHLNVQPLEKSKIPSSPGKVWTKWIFKTHTIGMCICDEVIGKDCGKAAWQITRCGTFCLLICTLMFIPWRQPPTIGDCFNETLKRWAYRFRNVAVCWLSPQKKSLLPCDRNLEMWLARGKKQKQKSNYRPQPRLLEDESLGRHSGHFWKDWSLWREDP